MSVKSHYFSNANAKTDFGYDLLKTPASRCSMSQKNAEFAVHSKFAGRIDQHRRPKLSLQIINLEDLSSLRDKFDKLVNHDISIITGDPGGGASQLGGVPKTFEKIINKMDQAAKKGGKSR